LQRIWRGYAVPAKRTWAHKGRYVSSAEIAGFGAPRRGGAPMLTGRMSRSEEGPHFSRMGLINAVLREKGGGRSRASRAEAFRGEPRGGGEFAVDTIAGGRGAGRLTHSLYAHPDGDDALALAAGSRS
jgi:hypothetical protein